ncbi:MAG: hypothetical protein RR595_14360 [Lysinibacillus sp.]
MIILRSLLENIHTASLAILLICSFFYYRQLKKMKRKRRLSTFEFSMYIILQLAYLLSASSYLLILLGA